MDSMSFGIIIALVSFFLGQPTPYFACESTPENDRLINFVWNPLYGFGYWYMVDLCDFPLRHKAVGIIGDFVWPVILFALVCFFAGATVTSLPVRIVTDTFFLATLFANTSMKNIFNPPFRNLPFITKYHLAKNGAIMSSRKFGRIIAMVTLFFGPLARSDWEAFINVIWNPLYGLGFWFTIDVCHFYLRGRVAGIFGGLVWPAIVFIGVSILARAAVKQSLRVRIFIAVIFLATLFANITMREAFKPTSVHLPYITDYDNAIY